MFVVLPLEQVTPSTGNSEVLEPEQRELSVLEHSIRTLEDKVWS